MLYSFYDIGANIGWHTWNCRAYIQDVPIHVFEPDNNNILLINRTIQHSALTGITVHSVALSDKDCESYFHLDTITSVTGTLEISQKSWTEE